MSQDFKPQEVVVKQTKEEIKKQKEEIKAQKLAEKEAVKAQQEYEREKAAKKKAIEKKEKKSLWKRLKETFSELKKVSWPKFSSVVKATGVVISVVLFFTLVLFGFDTVLGLLYDLFVGTLRP